MLNKSISKMCIFAKTHLSWKFISKEVGSDSEYEPKSRFLERLCLINVVYLELVQFLTLLLSHSFNNNKESTQNYYNDLQGSLNKFPDFFSYEHLLIIHTWNSSPLRSNLFRLQCTCCTVPTTSGGPHRSPLVWACQWPSSQPLSSPQLSHNDSLWA